MAYDIVTFETPTPFLPLDAAVRAGNHLGVHIATCH
jgi:hypothetical protein